MLLEFGFKNFFSFKEGAVISYKLDANCPKNISNGQDFSTALVVKGANASGKTNILRALSFLSYFAAHSFKSEPNSLIPISPYFESKEPSEFYIEFKVEDIIYFYELVCNQHKIISEKIFKKNKRKIKLLERSNDHLTFIKPNESLDNLSAIKVIKPNASIISTAHQYGFNDLEVIYNFFNTISSNVRHDGLDINLIDIRKVSKILNEDNSLLKEISSFIADCDTGVSNINITEIIYQNNEKQYFPLFVHPYEGNKEATITEQFESQGTKWLYKNLPGYFITLLNGGILILDDFDVHLHPYILPKLINLFINPETNPKNSQLLISTHDDGVLDLLGKYRTVLVNKEDNESFAYRLDELPGDLVRNDRSIVPPYTQGKLGGVPKL
jgi:AAA15 family ATPase/GTPase